MGNDHTYAAGAAGPGEAGPGDGRERSPDELLLEQMGGPRATGPVPKPAAANPGEDLVAWLEGGCALTDPQGRITELNEPLANWLEQPAVSLHGRLLWDLLESCCPSWTSAVAALRQSSATFNTLLLRRDEQPGHSAGWFQLDCVRHGAGTVFRIGSILPPLSDLEEGNWDTHLHSESARRQMFLRLLRAEEQLKSLSDHWPGVIFSQRADLSFRFVSPQIETLTGVERAAWTTKPHLFWQVVHEGDSEELRLQLRRSKESKQALTLTYRIRHAQTGQIAYVMEHRKAHVSKGGLLLGYEGVWVDVTRQTIAEKSLSTAASKETLSALTMGLAHDFSNVMAGIHALSESFLEQVEGNPEFREGLSLIKRNSHQASQLVHRIINLHQGKIGESSYYNLNDLVTELGDLVRKILPRRMQFFIESCPEPLPVYLDAVELRQVVINLVLNAIEAMPPEGSLTLRTSTGGRASPQTRSHGTFPGGPTACLSVIDTGPGIKPGHIANIFDPFFSTKQTNKGSGLGLYNARVFVQRHRGAISVETREGNGATFQLWLPQADFTELGPGLPSEQSGPPPRPFCDI